MRFWGRWEPAGWESCGGQDFAGEDFYGLVAKQRFEPTPANFPSYDVSPDGQRFPMLEPSDQNQSAGQFCVGLNWVEELKRWVPTGKK
jgi:hypothetical protein